MPADPHQLRPDHLPTPFTADEIRRDCQPGRMVRLLVVQPGADPIVRVVRFVSADADGGGQETWTESPDGERLSEPTVGRSRWLDLQRHASFPAASTEIAEETIDVPAGRFECLRYTNRDGDKIRTFWFARSAAGMPLRFEERRGELVTSSSTAIENVPAPSGAGYGSGRGR